MPGSVTFKEVRAGKVSGLGYRYADSSAAVVIRDMLAKTIVGLDPMKITFAWENMIGQRFSTRPANLFLPHRYTCLARLSARRWKPYTDNLEAG